MPAVNIQLAARKYDLPADYCSFLLRTSNTDVNNTTLLNIRVVLSHLL